MCTNCNTFSLSQLPRLLFFLLDSKALFLRSLRPNKLHPSLRAHWAPGALASAALLAADIIRGLHEYVPLGALPVGWAGRSDARTLGRADAFASAHLGAI